MGGFWTEFLYYRVMQAASIAALLIVSKAAARGAGGFTTNARTAINAGGAQVAPGPMAARPALVVGGTTNWRPFNRAGGSSAAFSFGRT